LVSAKKKRFPLVSPLSSMMPGSVCSPGAPKQHGVLVPPFSRVPRDRRASLTRRRGVPP
jgi:hypothetical protein